MTKKPQNNLKPQGGAVQDQVFWFGFWGGFFFGLLYYFFLGGVGLVYFFIIVWEFPI